MLVLANVLWSLNYATTKYAFGEWLPLAFSATRFLCAGIIFALFVLWREGSLRIRRSDVKLVVATAAVGILLNQLTFNYAVDKTTAGNTALILASAPAFAALFASLAGHEHVQRKHWLALAVSVAGVVLVIQGGSGVAGVSLVGDLLAVGAAITWAAYSVMLRPLFGRYSAARISALMVSIGGVMILPFGLPQMHEQDWARPQRPALGRLGILHDLPGAGHQPALLPRAPHHRRLAGDALHVPAAVPRRAVRGLAAG